MSPPALVPPFTLETAQRKVKAAQDLWNSMDPVKVSLAYTETSIWRNRDQFFSGRPAIVAFLSDKWAKEKEYRLRKRLFAFEGNRIAVQFWYEFLDAESGKWKRTYGLEHWTFNAAGLMEKRHMSGNDVVIREDERWFRDGVDIDEVEISDVHG